MTDVVSAEPPGENIDSAVSSRPNLDRLAGVRAAKLARLVLPPGHAAVLDVVVLIWIDGVEAGLQLSEQASTLGPMDGLEETLYAKLANAELCSEYDEFPELDDPDFQELAYRRVSALGKSIQPIGHPEMTWDMVEIWTDGVAAVLRIARDRASRSA